jgi:hypothetical protein
MAYSITNTDGSTLLLLADNTVDRATTSLTLIGKNVSNYGQYVNSNFIKLLENFANTNGNSPASPVTGQLWYNTTAQRLFIYDQSWSPVSGATVSSSQPGILSSGDFWWDSSNNQLKLFNNNSLYVIGPAFPQSVGTNGWVLPTNTLVDAGTLTPKQVTLLNNYGITVGMMSTEAFTLTSSDANTYFNTSTATVVAGLTINGSLQVSGQITNNYLSASVDIDYLNPSILTTLNSRNVTIHDSYILQNQAIADVLTQMFPVAANTATNEIGVPFGSEARVVCQFTVPSNGTEVRRFKVKNDVLQGISWQPVEIYSTGTKYYSVVTTSTTNVVM